MTTSFAKQDFSTLLERRDVIVCVGSGGVGKTTTSAVIALEAALKGQRALVLTIDPAKRLANSLGVERLSNEPTQIPLDQFRSIGLEPKGELFAMMLDMKQSFDDIIKAHAPNEASKHQILHNKLYHYFSTSLAGTQEYAAAERLYALYSSHKYDLIVLDTPPTSHALDFLEAPNRLVHAIDSRAMQWLYKPSILSSKSLMSIGTNYIIKTLSKFTGSNLLDELRVFLQAFSTLFGGFQKRAAAVRELLLSDATTFNVVTSPTAANIDEAIYFYNKLGADESRIGAFIVNRIHPFWVPSSELKRPAMMLAQELDTIHPFFGTLEEEEKKAFARTLRTNAADFQVLANLDAESIIKLRDHIPKNVPILRVPYFSHDIHSLHGLNHVRKALFSDSM